MPRKRRVPLGRGVDVVAGWGVVLRIRPGRTGLPVVAYQQALHKARLGPRAPAPRRGGRPPSKATLQLRAMLRRHRIRGRLRPAGDYARWLSKRTGSSLASARQTANRELGALLGGAR